jgi:vitamin B12 transporter
VLRRSFGERAWLAGGVEAQRQGATTASAFGPGLTDDRQTTRALFAQGGWTARALRLDLGVRRDEHSEFGGATSVKLGAVAALADGLRLRASWGESFRAPALGDLYFPFFGNPDLQPERGESVELGIELERAPLFARVTAFENQLEDLIQFDLVRFLPFNIGSARTRGVEAMVALRAGAFDARAQATWLDAEDRATGTPLPRRPELAANALLDWRRGTWSAGAAWRYVGEREDVGRLELPAHYALDLTAAWEPWRNLRATARLENALDRDYEEIAGFPAPGRRWVVGLTLRTGT